MSHSSRSPNRVVRLGVKAATSLFSRSLELFSNCSRISARSTSDSGAVVAADEFVCGFVGADVGVVAVPIYPWLEIRISPGQEPKRRTKLGRYGLIRS